jgi:hypothetical protein
MKLPELVRDVRLSVVELLNKPISDLKGHQAFKAEQEILALWAADCAEHVLPYFEEYYPKDVRPRKAIEECREWVRTGVFRMANVRKVSLAAHAAARDARDANHDAACFAARAAGHAMATAHVSTHAFGASAYATKAVAAVSNFMDVEVNVIKERNWQLQCLRYIAKV